MAIRLLRLRRGGACPSRRPAPMSEKRAGTSSAPTQQTNVPRVIANLPRHAQVLRLLRRQELVVSAALTPLKGEVSPALAPVTEGFGLAIRASVSRQPAPVSGKRAVEGASPYGADGRFPPPPCHCEPVRTLVWQSAPPSPADLRRCPTNGRGQAPPLRSRPMFPRRGDLRSPANPRPCPISGRVIPAPTQQTNVPP